MTTKVSKQCGKYCLLGKSELKSLLRNKHLIGLILSIVLTAYPDQESPEARKSMDFARKWLESLAREQIWLLLLLVKSSRQSEKLKPGKVQEALRADRVSRPASLAISIRSPKGHGSSDLTLLDVLPEGEDSANCIQCEHDYSLLRRKIWERAVEANLSGDECRLLKMLLEEDLDIRDVKQEGFFVEKKGKNGIMKRKKFVSTEVDEMYRRILRKLRCQELRDFVAEL